jgi:hypothetical protein
MAMEGGSVMGNAPGLAENAIRKSRLLGEGRSR